MKHRTLASFGVLMIAAVSLASAVIAGQSPSAAKPAAPAAKKWTAPRTPDGQPDLQGYWTNSTYVPLERGNNVTKAFYTEEEFAKVIANAATCSCSLQPTGNLGPNRGKPNRACSSAKWVMLANGKLR